MKNVLKNLVLLLLFCLMSLSTTNAFEIPNIVDNGAEGGATYPVRNDALVVVLQHVPDGSGEFIMNICNKQGHCYQTSMLPTERRYIGLFLEDMGASIYTDLKKDFGDKYIEKQILFRRLYADYMNKYDEVNGELKSITGK